MIHRNRELFQRLRWFSVDFHSTPSLCNPLSTMLTLASGATALDSVLTLSILESSAIH